MARKLFVGFTLIELLIVMAILGVLAVTVLVLVNPVDQLSRARDAGRISSVNQMGHQVQAYYTVTAGTYPTAASWDTELTDANELSFPTGIDYFSSNGVSECTTNARPSSLPTYCYSLDTVNNYGALVFTKLESKSQRSKCTSSGETPYFVYSTSDGRGGVICSSSDPTPWVPGSQNYLD